MTENMVLYLATINFLMLGLLFLLSRSLEKYRESLNEFAVYLQETLEEQIEEDDDGSEHNDARTRTEDAGE